MWVIGADIPHRRLCPANQDEKQSLGDGGLGTIVLGNVVLALSHRTVDDRNVVRLGVATNAPAKAAGQPHHMSIVQCRVRSGQLPPPQAEATGVMSHTEIPVQHDAINAVIAAAQEIVIKSAQPLAHDGMVIARWSLLQTAPKGPLFRSAVCDKA